MLTQQVARLGLLREGLFQVEIAAVSVRVALYTHSDPVDEAFNNSKIPGRGEAGDGGAEVMVDTPVPTALSTDHFRATSCAARGQVIEVRRETLRGARRSDRARACRLAEMGALQKTYTALVLDSSLHVTRQIPLAGIPNRSRVSPSGHMAAWTVFVGGDGYAQQTFSTRTSILDTRTGALHPSLEEYAVTKDGRPLHPTDANFWGVTFIDDKHFYATLGTGGQTYLIHGDVTTKTATTVRTNVECPSLSPDGTKIAFKKRVPGLPKNLPWRLYVLDLETMQEHPVAETRSVDDQAVWADGNNLVYSLPDYSADLYTVPADGSGAARVLANEALAPAWTG